jgi:hypothetical protein
LRLPPPVEQPLRVARDGDKVSLWDGEQLVAEAVPTSFDLSVPAAPTFAQAEAASRRFIGFDDHNFSTCFVCGTGRDSDDGLRIFPGPAGQELVAAPWVPDASLADANGVVQPEFVWAALDCPGAFASKTREEGGVIVLGRFQVELASEIRAGERCVVIGWPLGEDGRKVYAGTAIYGEDGRLCGWAYATWIEISVPVAA